MSKRPTPLLALSRFLRRQRPPTGDGLSDKIDDPDDGTLRQDITGASDGLAYLRHLVRGNRIRRRSFVDRVSNERPPVLLIHGFLGTRGSMWILERRLVDDGVPVFSFNLGTVNTRDIRESAVLIQRKIDAILAQVPVDKIDIVGHSMGGLIGLYYVKKLGGAAKVRRLVMMGTPITGTWSAFLGIATVGLMSASSWQIRPGSSFLAELADGPLPRSVEYTTIAAQRDWVCPVRSTFLEGARRIVVPLGHSSLVVSDVVYQHVKKALEG